MDKPTLLAVFAHPDDEAFGTGGSLSRYAASGDQVGRGYAQPQTVCTRNPPAGEQRLLSRHAQPAASEEYEAALHQDPGRMPAD